MADISKIVLPNGGLYNIKDANAATQTDLDELFGENSSRWFEVDENGNLYYCVDTEGGSGGGGSVNVQAKTVTPKTTQQVVTPDAGYNYLSQVTVNAVPYDETTSGGSTTVTIAGEE